MLHSAAKSPTRVAIKRIIPISSGKGGVGKTSVAAATGVRLSQLGYRTLVMSVDPAHSLGDSFDLEGELFHGRTSDPLRNCEAALRRAASLGSASAAMADLTYLVEWPLPTSR